MMRTFDPAAHQWPHPGMILIDRGLIDVRSDVIRSMPDSEDILVRFGARVRELRMRQGYSQESFATECNLDRTYIGGIERGERNVALRNIQEIARALDISLSELTRGLSGDGR